MSINESPAPVVVQQQTSLGTKVALWVIAAGIVGLFGILALCLLGVGLVAKGMSDRAEPDPASTACWRVGYDNTYNNGKTVWQCPDGTTYTGAQR